MLTDTARAEIHCLLHRIGQFFFIHLAGAIGLHIHRKGLGDANRVSHLNRAALRQFGRNHILGKITRGIGRRTINLGRVFAGESTATMGGRATIGVDDDLAAGEAGVTIGTTNHETTGRVHIEFVFRAHPAIGKYLLHMGTHNRAHIVLAQFLGMLGRDHHRSGANRLAVFIAQRDLAFGIRSEAQSGIRMAGIGERAQNGV